MNSRADLRKETRKDVIATILGYPDVALPGHIRNYSESGLCLTLSRAIPAGGAVKVEWDDHFLLGRVRRVSPDGLQFRVGLELYHGRWNRLVSSELAP
jgi:PilZ domain